VTPYEINVRKGGKSVSVKFSVQGALLEDEEEED
jgi:hypothetical protein